jgi:hypothetical protein
MIASTLDFVLWSAKQQAETIPIVVSQPKELRQVPFCHFTCLGFLWHCDNNTKVLFVVALLLVELCHCHGIFTGGEGSVRLTSLYRLV